MIIVEVEIRALKIYSPNGPRNGAVIIFLTQSCKNLWLTKISEIITLHTSDPAFPSPPPSSPHHLPSSPHPRISTMISTITPPQSISPAIFHMKGRRVSSRPTVLNGISHHNSSKHDDSSVSSVRASPILMSRSCFFSFDQPTLPENRYVRVCMLCW